MKFTTYLQNLREILHYSGWYFYLMYVIQQDQEFTGQEREKEKLTYSNREECYNPDVGASI